MSRTAASTGPWRKSARCESSSCVEVASLDGLAGIRNSTAPETHLVFGPADWSAFLAGVRAGEFDLH
ncbi:MAG TPA: DUF397 domain-containing protein [Pilimelia sp.]|nr:DUF397 domain-containing protein [Pilimelia sp.]